MEGAREQADDVGQAGSADTIYEGDAGLDASVESTVTVVRKRSIWDDPVVRMMGFAVAALVVLYLLAIVSALYFGLIGNAAPRTIQERDLTRLELIAGAPEATLDQLQTYVQALIADGQYVRAKQVIDRTNANEELDQTQGEYMLFCLAEMQRAQGDHEAALATYDEVMSLTKAAYEEEFETGGEFQNWAIAYGLHDNYFMSALGKSVIYQEQEEWASALEAIDVFLTENPRQAGILVDRAFIKLQLGDEAGAEADYREALRYIPDYPEALEGLEQIGVGE
jgi:tetratricopeptide (TPR) repeat protein